MSEPRETEAGPADMHEVGPGEAEPRRPWGRRPLPAKSDWRRALDVYRAGRSRALTADEKRRIAAFREEERQSPKPGAATQPADPVYGVSVPSRLAFHRNAGTWRNDLPEPKSRGDRTSRD